MNPLPRNLAIWPPIPLLALSLSLAQLPACGQGTPGDAPASGQERGEALTTLDAPIAVKITQPSQLIGGPRADGRVGDYLLDNGLIRVIVQDMGRGIGFHPLGGNVIDGDVVREAGEAGGDLLGEIMTAVNLHTLVAPQGVEIVSSGVAGLEAVLRIQGETQSFPLFPPREGMESLPLVIQEEYILRPGERNLEIRTTFTNPTDRTIAFDCGDLFFFGTNLVLSGAGNAYGEGAGRVPYLTAHHETLTGASYGWTTDDREMLVPFEDASQSGAVQDAERLKAGRSKACYRYLIIGDGDSASVTDEYFRMGEVGTGTIEGRLELGTQGYVDEARAIITNLDGGYVTDALAKGEDGFTAEVPPGRYNIAWLAPDGRALPPLEIFVQEALTTLTTDVLSLPGEVMVHCKDEASQAQPCRVVASGPTGRSFHFSETGHLPMTLAPGAWNLTISRGMERAIVQLSTDIESGEDYSFDAVLPRQLDTSGWIAMDSHLHAIRSNDSGTPLREKVRRLVAEGVEVAISTEHDRISDYGPAARALGVDDLIKTVVGNEVSVIDYGHFNAYPLVPSEADPTEFDGSQLWMMPDSLTPLSASELFNKLRGTSPEQIIQINHPRDGAKGYLDMIAYNAEAGRGRREALATDFDAVEIQTSVFGDEAVLLDFFSFLAQGLTPTAVGSSDAHQADDHNGMPRTWLKVDEDNPGLITEAEIISAIKNQAATVSSGIFGEVSVEGAGGGVVDRPGATLDGQGDGQGGAVTFRAALQSPTWGSIAQFSLFENGQPLKLTQGEGNRFVISEDGSIEPTLTATLNGGRLEASLEVEVQPEGDAHYVLLVWGDAPQALSGHLPILLTNPIYVDQDGGGWQPPGRGRALGPLPPRPDIQGVNWTGH